LKNTVVSSRFVIIKHNYILDTDFLCHIPLLGVLRNDMFPFDCL
jgi:hypothetical protein